MIVFFAEAPHFIALSAGQLAHVVDKFLFPFIPGAALPVHAEYRAEAPPGKPPYQQFLEIRIGNVAADKAANIARPPGNAGHGHTQACLQLFPHGPEGGIHIAAPGEHAVFLAACPGTAHQAHNLLFPFCLQPVIKPLGITHRIGVGALHGRAGKVAVIVKIVQAVFRFCFIQPEAADAQVVIIFFALIPHIFLCSGMGGVKEGGIAHPGHVDGVGAIGGHQIPS